jgi:hypothetical protein
VSHGHRQELANTVAVLRYLGQGLAPEQRPYVGAVGTDVQNEPPVLGELLAAAEVHASRRRVLLVLERLLDLLAVDPVAQRPGMGAAVRVVARMLSRGRRAAVVGVGTMVGPVALLEDGPATVDRQSMTCSLP